MAERIIIPRMGQTMTEGTVASWYVKDGDVVKPGDDIYELEYDKSTASVQAKTAGTVKLLCEEGDTVPLGKAVAIILAEGETLDNVNIDGDYQVANSAEADYKDRPNEENNISDTKAAEVIITGKVLATPLARKLARDRNIDITTIIKSESPDGIIRASDVRKYKTEVKEIVHDCEKCSKCGNDILATPLARKIAKERNIDLRDIKPRDSIRIYKADVLAYKPENKPASDDVKSVLAGRRVKMTGLRKLISERMTKSYFTYPTVTLNTTADMYEFLKMREQLNGRLKEKDIKLSITDMLIKVIAKALKENEIINSSIEGNEILYHEDINIGFAVSLDAGLAVPVLKNADRLSFEEISKETKRLIKLAKERKLSPEELNGGTFSITNLGMFGIDTFNPIINYPQSAILGIGRTVDTYVLRDGQGVFRPIMSLSITHDHRVIDGTPAANFLKTVVGYIENPFTLFID